MNKLLEIALTQYGIKEISGKQHNAAVLKYYKAAGANEVATDEVPWCSAFVNWCAQKAGLAKTDSLLARSWLKVGKEVQTSQMGDIVVLKRGKEPWQGHVGIYINEDKNFIYILGGNQNNQVNIKPYDKTTVLGYRRLSEIEKQKP